MPRRSKGGSWFLLLTSFLLIIYFNKYFNFLDFSDSTVLASVNDIKITRSQLRQFAVNSFGSFDQQRSKEFLDMMINHEILIIHAERTGITNNILMPQFQKQERYARERIMLEMFFDLEAELNIEVTKQEIENYYNNNRLFVLRAIQFFFSDEYAEQKSRLAIRELNRGQRFIDVMRIFYPDTRADNTGFIGVINAETPPDYLIEYMSQLNRSKTTTEPIEDQFAYVIYYRDERPTLKEAEAFILREITAQKANELQEQRLLDITRNNRVNMFVADNFFNQGFTANRNENIASNRISNQNLSIAELLTRLSDLYNIHNINNLTYEEFLEYINLFISQKVIIALAEENDFFQNRRFLSAWGTELFQLQQNQKQETIDYIISYIYDTQINEITDQEILNFYQKNRSLFRRSDFFKLQTIVINERNYAYRVYNEALTNTDFNSLVLLHSNDPFAVRTLGIGPFLDRTRLTESYDLLVNSKIGDIIQPIEAETGVWHIYKIIDRVQGALRPVDEVIPQVITAVMHEKLQNYIRQLILNYRIEVVIHEDRL